MNTTKRLLIATMITGMLAAGGPASAETCETQAGIATDLVTCEAEVGVASDGDGGVTVQAEVQLGADVDPAPGIHLDAGISEEVDEQVTAPTVTTPGVSTPGLDGPAVGAHAGPIHMTADVDLAPVHVGPHTVGLPAAEFEASPMWNGEGTGSDDDAEDDGSPDDRSVASTSVTPAPSARGGDTGAVIAPDAPVRAARLEGSVVGSAGPEDAAGDHGCDGDLETGALSGRRPLHTAGFDVQPAAEQHSTYVPVGLLALVGSAAFLYCLASIDTRRRERMGI